MTEVMNTKQAFDYWINIEKEYLKTIKYVPNRPFKTPRELQVWIWKEIFQETSPFSVVDFIAKLHQVKKLWQMTSKDALLTEDEQKDSKALTQFFGEDINDNTPSQSPRIPEISNEEYNKEFEEWKEKIKDFEVMNLMIKEKEEKLKKKENELMDKEKKLLDQESNVRSREAEVMLCDIQYDKKEEKLKEIEQILDTKKKELKELQLQIKEQQKILDERIKTIETKEQSVEGKKKQLEIDEKVLKIRMEEAEKVIKSPENISRVHSMDLCNLSTLASPRNRGNKPLTPTISSPRMMILMSRERKASLDPKEGEDTLSNQVRNLLKENFTQMQEINILKEGLEEARLENIRQADLLKTQTVFTEIKSKKTLSEEEIDQFIEVLTKLIDNKSKETREAMALGIYGIVKIHIPKTQNAILRKSLCGKTKFKYSTRRKSADMTPLEIKIESAEMALSISQFANDEFHYFQGLVEFNEIYVKALLATTTYKKLGEQISQVLTPLITLSRNIVNGLEESMSRERTVPIGELMKKYLDNFNVFTEYFSNYQTMTKTFPDIQENLELNKQVVLCISAYVQTQRDASISNGSNQNFTPPLPQSPATYLHFPISRLEEYVKFFAATIKQSAPINNDYSSLNECYEALKTIHKSSLSLLQTAASLDDLSLVEMILRKSTGALVQKRRKLLYYGLLIPINDEFPKKGPRLCFLMSDMLLITVIKKVNDVPVDDGWVMRKFTSSIEWTKKDLMSLVINEEIRIELNPPVTGLVVSDGEVHNAFLVIQNDIKLHFIACSECNRDKWLNLIESL
ncbi:hypothetical protein KM1_065020 [Entamoeba histolytica HM-3:IMSS]|uniref:DH domain-containing protein n=1 Tax=Entamoeba histolytica HM-3:IMSS TaxID=885315 RepID=M7WIC1_ENTHI|nr:hypothetical protein KM1_065020 [Entamoeba histolytica HM-3:IMSS]